MIILTLEKYLFHLVGTMQINHLMILTNVNENFYLHIDQGKVNISMISILQSCSSVVNVVVP